jgi:uncharacterized protein YkwD
VSSRWLRLAVIPAALAVVGGAAAFALDGGPALEERSVSRDPSRSSAATITSSPTTTAVVTTTMVSATTAPTSSVPPPTTAGVPTGATPPPAPGPAPVPAAVPAVPAGMAGGVLSEVNAMRAARGLAGLAWHGGLAACAQSWAQHIADIGQMVHSDYRCGLGAGMSSVGENLYYAFGANSTSSLQVAEVWRDSPPHAAHLFSSAFRFAGVGVASSADGRIWVVMEFGT